MKKIAMAGSILLDVVKKIDAWPEKGMLVTIGEISRAVGGCVCNSGIDLKKLDESISVEAYGKVGGDENGTYVLNALRENGVGTEHVKISTLPTSFTDVMTLRETGERTFFTMRGASSDFTEEDVDLDTLDCDIFHLGYLLLLDGLDAPDPEYGTRAARLLHDVGAKGIRTSIDLVSEQSDRFSRVVLPALPYCDYCVINEVEGGRLCGIDPCEKNGEVSVDRVRMICEALLEKGVRDTVVIHCPAFSCSLEKQGAFTVVPSLELPDGYIVGSVGAGDAFCAGMLYSFLYGVKMEEGMQIASSMAACNLAAADSVSGAETLENTMKLNAIYQRRNLSC